MKDVLPGYYRPTDEEFKLLWDEGTVIPDTNVLLNLYRFSEGTRDELIKLFEAVSPRLWIPYQAALEYHRNRLGVIREVADTCQTTRGSIKSTLAPLQNRLESMRHPHVDSGKLLAELEQVKGRLESLLDEAQSKQSDLLETDPVLLRVTELFAGKTGKPPTDEETKDRRKNAEARFTQKIPPGYKDAQTKEGDKQYGDAYIWFEIIAYAKEHKKPILLITDDSKEDWWWKRHDGKTLGPRPELINEMHQACGTLFYMYSTERFIDFANQQSAIRIPETTTDEVREVVKAQRLRGGGDTLAGQDVKNHVLAVLDSLSSKLPFVGVKYLVSLSGPGANHAVAELVKEGVLRYYKVPNPNAPAFPTTAVKFSDDLDMPDEGA